jgi:hypothetical protein
MKKKFNSIIITTLLVGIAFSLSSCLKDSNNYVNVSQSPPLGELPLEAYWGIGTPIPVTVSASSPTIQFAVNIASANTLSSSTTFSLAAAPGDVAAFTTSSGNVALPAANYSPTSWSIVVPAGQHLGYGNITINTTGLSTSNTTYYMAVKLVSATGLTIDQFNELVYAITVTP